MNAAELDAKVREAIAAADAADSGHRFVLFDAHELRPIVHTLPDRPKARTLAVYGKQSAARKAARKSGARIYDRLFRTWEPASLYVRPGF